MSNALLYILAGETSGISEGLWGLVLKGGWLMLPIFALSVIAVYIACERYWTIRKIRPGENTFAKEIKQLLLTGQQKEALRRCAALDSTLARVLAKGAARATASPGEIRKAMEDRANLEIAHLERGMALLASCAGTAPMIGFLGTVIGMIQAFYDMATAGGSVDITLLSRGIYTALITTVAGLIVGIIGNLAYNHLVAMTDRRVHWLEAIIEEFVEIPVEA
jgi:biopolymer transport protein ExbB